MKSLLAVCVFLLLATRALASFGNVLGGVSSAQVTWNAARVNLYAPTEGYAPPRLSPGAPTHVSLTWRTRALNAAGLVQLGERPYDPSRRAFLSADPLGHPSDSALNTAFNQNPGKYFDPDGRCGIGSSLYQNAESGEFKILNNYDLFYLGAARSLAGESVSGDYRLRSQLPITDWPISDLGNQSFRMMFGDTASAFGEAAVMLATGPVGMPGEFIEAWQEAGKASVSGTAGDQAFAYTRAGADTLMAFAAIYFPARGFASRNYSAASNPNDFAAETGVQANKLAGDAMRDVIALREAPALREVSLETVGGIRRTDVLKLGDEVVGIESKVGRTALDSRVRQELARDWWLRRQGVLDRVQWEFSPSQVTGEVGPTRQLADKLQKLGFDVRVNGGQ